MSETASNVSVGVQELLTKLQEDGVSRGRKEGDKVIARARTEAEKITADAKAKAETILANAKKEAEFVENAGKDSLEMAARNTILELKSFLLEKFSDKIREAVSLEMKDEGLLQKIIIEVAGRTGISAEHDIEVLLPESVAAIEDLKEHPEKVKSGTLAYFVAEKAHEILKDGVTFGAGSKTQTGVTFRLKNKDIQVDLDENAVSDMLLKHLQPRFRALLEGIIH